MTNGGVKCWGANPEGQLGLEDTNARGVSNAELGDNLPYVDLGSGRTTVAITAASDHTCALLDNGKVKCWGTPSYGRLGIGSSAKGNVPGTMGDSLPYVELGTGRTAVAISTYFGHTCVILDNAKVKCWGASGKGQLGYEETASRGTSPSHMGDNLPYVDLGTGRTAVAISAGDSFTCAILNRRFFSFAGGSRLKCWGVNGRGQLGQGHDSNRGTAAGQMGNNLVETSLGTNRYAVAIATGTNHACAVLDNAKLKCWGKNGRGQLGYGDTATRGKEAGDMGDNLPYVDIGTGRTAVAVSAGMYTTCVRMDNGQAKCWGGNDKGNLLRGDTFEIGSQPGQMGDSLAELDLGTSRTPTLMGLGKWYACARLDNGMVKCWGRNRDGRLGIGREESFNAGNQSGENGDMLAYAYLFDGEHLVPLPCSDGADLAAIPTSGLSQTPF